MRTQIALRGRGGALVAGYDSRAARPRRAPAAGTIAADALWDNLRWFLERVLPVAEEVGVRLALHPDDPPLPSYRGIARILHDVDGFQRSSSCSRARPTA